MIDGIAGGAWDIYDAQTVKELMQGKNHIEFRTVSVNPQRDYQWNTKKINSELTSGILQGKSRAYRRLYDCYGQLIVRQR